MPNKHRPRRTSPLNLPGAFELFTPSKDLILRHINIFAPLYFLPFIFWFHSWASTPATGSHYFARISDANYSFSSFPAAYFATFIGFSIIWLLVTVVGGTIIQIMTQDAQLRAVEDKSIAFNKLWATTKELVWRMLGLYIVLGLVIGIGFALLIIPGLFMVRRYILAPYVMLDKKCSIGEAMTESARLSLVNTGSIWGLMGVVFLIGLIGIVPIIGSLASFVLGVLYSVAPALRYQQLKNLA